MRFVVLAASVALACCALLLPAHAHVSERALVLILPTNIYITFGVAAVVVTVCLTILVPSDSFKALVKFGPDGTDAAADGKGRVLASILSFVLLLVLTVLGFAGPRDPLENLLPLFLLTAWWICFPVAQALLQGFAAQFTDVGSHQAAVEGQKQTVITMPDGFFQNYLLETKI